MYPLKMDCEVKYYKLLDLKHFKSFGGLCDLTEQAPCMCACITDLPNHSNLQNSKNFGKKSIYSKFVLVEVVIIFKIRSNSNTSQ